MKTLLNLLLSRTGHIFFVRILSCGWLCISFSISFCRLYHVIIVVVVRFVVVGHPNICLQYLLVYFTSCRMHAPLWYKNLLTNPGAQVSSSWEKLDRPQCLSFTHCPAVSNSESYRTGTMVTKNTWYPVPYGCCCTVRTLVCNMGTKLYP